MSDQAGQVDAPEDVLSSIRRLMSEGGPAPLRRGRDKLVLTEAQRVEITPLSRSGKDSRAPDEVERIARELLRRPADPVVEPAAAPRTPRLLSNIKAAVEAPAEVTPEVMQAPHPEPAPAAEPELQPAPPSERKPEPTLDDKIAALEKILGAQRFDEEAEPTPPSNVIRLVHSADAPASGTVTSDDLRAMVSDIVREELQGALGEKITRNVRKLIRREIQRAIMDRD